MTTLNEPRRLTLAHVLTQLLNTPIVAAVAATWIMLRLPSSTPGRMAGWACTLLFLTVIPLLSLLFYIPFGTRDHERVLKRQRRASFVFYAISYPLGLLALHLMAAPVVYRAIVMSYVAVVLGLVAINAFYKASGHAAGVAGPVSALIYLRGWIALPLLALIPLVAWARVQLKGHTTMQTVVGGCLSAVATLVVLGLYGLQVGMLAR